MFITQRRIAIVTVLPIPTCSITDKAVHFVSDIIIVAVNINLTIIVHHLYTSYMRFINLFLFNDNEICGIIEFMIYML